MAALCRGLGASAVHPPVVIQIEAEEWLRCKDVKVEDGYLRRAARGAPVMRSVLGLRGAEQAPVKVVDHGLRCNCEECYATTESESE